MARIPRSPEFLELSNAQIKNKKKVYGEDFTPNQDEIKLADAHVLIQKTIYGDDYIGDPSQREIDIVNKPFIDHPDYKALRALQQERAAQIEAAEKWFSLNLKKKGRPKRFTVDRNELYLALNESFGLSAKDYTPKSGDVDPYKSGFPGRPTSKYLIITQLRAMWAEGQRFSKRNGEQCINDWARALARWLKQKHPNAQQAALKTIENNIREVVRALQAAPTEAPPLETPEI